jgi:hypothetical protein
MTPAGAVVAPSVVVGHISMLEWQWKRVGVGGTTTVHYGKWHLKERGNEIF